jgi:hypothetical protein
VKSVRDFGGIVSAGSRKFQQNVREGNRVREVRDKGSWDGKTGTMRKGSGTTLMSENERNSVRSVSHLAAEVTIESAKQNQVMPST